MQYQKDFQEKYILLKLEEAKLDATIAAQVKAELISLVTQQRNLILDLSQVKYIDSSGLSVLLVANRMCKESEGILVLAGVTDHVHKLIKISQLDTVLELLPTVAEAVDAVFMNELEKDLGREFN
jgi:anti-sigma B factor antagonist